MTAPDTLIAANMTERELQNNVVAMARVLGWLVCGCTDGIISAYECGKDATHATPKGLRPNTTRGTVRFKGRSSARWVLAVDGIHRQSRIWSLEDGRQVGAGRLRAPNRVPASHWADPRGCRVGSPVSEPMVLQPRASGSGVASGECSARRVTNSCRSTHWAVSPWA